ncbi:hypothetical protein [Bartonella sp. Raccoon60]|uniref:hypothetical protein n=1 Tax=Bartonella sp. Raccoon60 TaxID=1933912 RepID=UPI00099965E6|nr:hypothetical protein [Bartonella sp. Raccoon60]AQX26286.1 hypothetical protein Bra60_002640 [Bartonella sp. Raccoon60]
MIGHVKIAPLVQDKYPDLEQITNYLHEIADNSLKVRTSLYPQSEDSALREQQIGAELRQICQQAKKPALIPSMCLCKKQKLLAIAAPQNNNEVEALQERNTAAWILAACGRQVPLVGIDMRTLSSMSEDKTAAWVENNKEKFEYIMDRV